MKTIPIKYTVTLRPETYRRLAELAALGKEDVSDVADEVITDHLDEQDELDKLQGDFCPVCTKPACPGGCFDKFVHDAGLMGPPKQ